MHLAQTLDDRYVLDGCFDADGGATVATALRLAGGDEIDDQRRPARRRADALVEVCRFFLDHQRSRPGGRHRPHLNVVVDVDALVEGTGGRVIGGASLDGGERVEDAVRLRPAPGADVGAIGHPRLRRLHPHHPRSLWSALVVRDEHCRFPGCDRPSTWCEGHHVRWVAHGGATDIDIWCSSAPAIITASTNPGGQAKLLPDAAFEVTHPDGIVRCTSPPRADPGW